MMNGIKTFVVNTSNANLMCAYFKFVPLQVRKRKPSNDKKLDLESIVKKHQHQNLPEH